MSASFPSREQSHLCATTPFDDMDATVGFQYLVEDFADEIGRLPTLVEFLEILGWAIPPNCEALDDAFTIPLKLEATVRSENDGVEKMYLAREPSQVCELNDNVFSEAVEQNIVLVEQIKTGGGKETVSPSQFAMAVLRILQTGRVPLADVKGESIHRIYPVGEETATSHSKG